MAGHIVFENVPIIGIIDDISVKAKRDYNTSPYIGGTGSKTNFVSELGRVITFKSIVASYDVLEGSDESVLTTYNNLSETYKNKTGVLTSNSELNLKGNYLITGFDVTEDTGNNFNINWEFTEVIPFNVVNKTFRVWGSASQSNASKKSNKNGKASGNKVNKTSKTLLTKCSTLSPSNKASACVKYLQKFLQSLGYYKKYKVDGIYAQHTKQEVKKLQKAHKLKQTGNWDKDTIKYFRNKYKISTTPSTVKSVKNTIGRLFGGG